MSLQAPVIAIAPSLRNDFVMLARDLVPDEELRGALNDPESYYSQRRAEIRLLLDLLLPAADASAVTTSAPRVTQPAKPLTGRQLLR
jgi:hypothetical protein